jgi:glycosyltransferase involved in cell wall biosynthesis
MKILYLYPEVMGYTMATIKALVERGAEVHVVQWDHKKLTPYQVPSWLNVHMYKRSEMSIGTMHRLAENLSPAITVISGWMDKGYMAVARRLRAQGKIVVAGFDSQWHGTLKQNIAMVLGRLGYFSRYYSHAWVSGGYQFEYVRRLGFRKKNIVYDLYSADLSLFQNAYQSNLRQKQRGFPHRFLFVGRFEPIKGLDTLMKAWQVLADSRRDWELHLVGNGPLKPTLQATPGVVIKDFMQPELLMGEVANAGCFVLPSRGEPWGVVVHEFAAAGIPLIVSDVVGAASIFLISGLNGFSFKANDSQSLAKSMQRVIDSSEQQLITMAKASHELSNRISPHTSAANLLSIINQC